MHKGKENQILPNSFSEAKKQASSAATAIITKERADESPKLKEAASDTEMKVQDEIERQKVAEVPLHATNNREENKATAPEAESSANQEDPCVEKLASSDSGITPAADFISEAENRAIEDEKAMKRKKQTEAVNAAREIPKTTIDDTETFPLDYISEAEKRAIEEKGDPLDYISEAEKRAIEEEKAIKRKKQTEVATAPRKKFKATVSDTDVFRADYISEAEIRASSGALAKKANEGDDGPSKSKDAPSDSDASYSGSVSDSEASTSDSDGSSLLTQESTCDAEMILPDFCF